jgi:hypothetical protein
MTEQDGWPAEGLGLADAIRSLRDEPLVARAPGGKLEDRVAGRVEDLVRPKSSGFNTPTIRVIRRRWRRYREYRQGLPGAEIELTEDVRPLMAVLD